MLYRATRGRPAALLAFGMIGMLLASSGGAVAQTATYHDFDALTAALRAAVDGSNAASMRALGESQEGREIWLVEIAGAGELDPAERPAVLVVGNLEGNHVVGSEIGLGIVQHLLSGAEGTETVLANNTVYVVPRLNPDGAEAMFAAVKTHRSGNGRPVDDDNDGRVDEDPAEDLNGDGVVTMMRVMDPEGAYMVDPDEPRVMRPADAAKGESGAYSIYWEGVDSDGDSFYNEDGIGGVDLNRNFQHAYPYFEPDAGRHMVSESETRALMDFVVAQRNIAAILAFGLSDNLLTDYDRQGNLGGTADLDLSGFASESNAGVYDVGVFRQARGFGFGGFGFFGGGGGGGGLRLRGAQPGADNDPNAGRRPETTFHADDRSYLGAVAEMYQESSDGAEVGLNRVAEGSFFQYGYFQYGVPSFSTAGWAPAAAAEDAAASEGDAQLLARLDGAGIDAFVDWAPFSHPQLGEVEIGGFRPYVTHNPPADQLSSLGQQHGEFVAELAGKLPRVELVDTSVTSHGGGVFTVTAEIVNSGYFPTALRQGMTSRSVQATMVQIQVDPDDVLTGDAKTSTVARLDGSGGRASFSWVIRGEEGADVEIRVRAQKGGTDSATVTLR